MKKQIILSLMGAALISSCSSTSTVQHQTEPDLKHLDYLEQIHSPEVQKFVEGENKLSAERLRTDPLYPVIEKEALDILTAKDKLPDFYMYNQMIYEFWQDQTHVRGQLRRMSTAEFNHHKTNWEVVLDIDILAKEENKNWVWKGYDCSKKNRSQCLMFLSDGGKDALTAREFSLDTKQFIKDGFNFPESKSDFTWYDENTILWADGTDKEKLTNSGYPGSLKMIKRGQKLSEAKTLVEVAKNYVGTGASALFDQGKVYFFLRKEISFYEVEISLIESLEPFKVTKINIPSDARFQEIFHGQFLFSTKSEYTFAGKTYVPGTLLSFPISDAKDIKKIDVVFSPSEKQVFQNVTLTQDSLWIDYLNDVKAGLTVVERKNDSWVQEPFVSGIPNTTLGNWNIQGSFNESTLVYLSYTDFLAPNRYYFLDTAKPKVHTKLLMSAPTRFDARGYEVHQYRAKSNDGTEVPYFVVQHKHLKLDGKNPTFLYGYGGFEVPLTPRYMSALGKSWLSRGGVYVLANIRGGGEYGPKWHQAAMRENRQKAYDDFIAIAEDLIQRKITSPKHLGIEGGSNGGLLTSVMLTQRPDLFGAVISEVPLTNMMRYHKLLAGASWIAEYGNPDDPKDREFILKYSPVQNIKKDVQYPEALYITSTKDDRVHPAHAREMVARMREFGHPIIYFENTDGGHGRAANLTEYSSMIALELTYFFQKLR